MNDDDSKRIPLDEGEMEYVLNLPLRKTIFPMKIGSTVYEYMKTTCPVCGTPHPQENSHVRLDSWGTANIVHVHDVCDVCCTISMVTLRFYENKVMYYNEESKKWRIYPLDMKNQPSWTKGLKKIYKFLFR